MCCAQIQRNVDGQVVRQRPVHVRYPVMTLYGRENSGHRTAGYHSLWKASALPEAGFPRTEVRGDQRERDRKILEARDRELFP